ncbi:WD40 repeat-like protein [Gonapodya prolifera JEL478]|uniref:Peroxin-7 n=1 Tax=Gonapodya prolifera (strain JEL478) TaxID=1344416 RepID=A0A139A8R7_GONPJ|nr:WD40 repeat-like protein [Gonapodya prolifera JEL478]|eukprot:KXS13201.1 WD40 repeat-like protein [Gonapodya prolifera JEL478]
MLRTFRTEGHNGYACPFSPFFENRIAVASAANFGIVGNGRLWILDINAPPAPGPPGAAGGGVALQRSYDTQDGLFDACWSELNENQIVACSGDGSIKLFDTGVPDPFPIANWREHSREVFSVSWNQVKKDTFVSSSWDHTVKVWNPTHPRSLLTFSEHTHCVYTAAYHPSHPDLLASCSGDHTLKLWDLKTPRSVATIRAHANEVLSCDWNKYKEHVVVTGGVDHEVRVWDTRNPAAPVTVMRGHEYAVRRVRCSPHNEAIVASAGYDMTVRFWDTNLAARAGPGGAQGAGCVFVHDRHTEFVLGVDFSLYVEGLVATAAWDEWVHVFAPPVVGRR